MRTAQETTRDGLELSHSESSLQLPNKSTRQGDCAVAVNPKGGSGQWVEFVLDQR